MIARPEAATPVRELSAKGLIAIVRDAAAQRSAVWVRVTGKSMNPIVREGDGVLLVSPRANPRPGDVVFLDTTQGPLLHRVVVSTPDAISTRGDSCSTNDPPQRTAACIAQAVAVRRGDHVVALTPRVYVGLGPMARYAAWRVRLFPPIAAVLELAKSFADGDRGRR
ncbi:MAG: S24/S26 family peptidase [Gemmatimonadaceae bacterium]